MFLNIWLFTTIYSSDFIYPELWKIKVDIGMVSTRFLDPYAFRFAIRSSWLRQSNAYDKSVNKAPNILPMFAAASHFPSKAKRHCWLL